MNDTSSARWQVHPEVARAETLDKAFYLDPAVQRLQYERVLARSWQWLSDLHGVQAPGSLQPETLLPGSLDEPLLLARDALGTLRCLSNVCTHRGNLLIHQPCADATQIRCGYHSRRFELDGRMSFMPEFQQALDFPRPCDHLPRLALRDWGGQSFVSLAAEPLDTFDAFFGPALQRLHWLPLQDFRLDASRSRDYEFDAHWALYVENYLEGLHIPFVHPGLAQTLDLGQYRYELHGWSNLQLAVAREDETAFELPPEAAEHGQRIAAYYWWVFPNLMLNFYPWGLSLNQVLPIDTTGPARTRVRFRSYVWKPELLGRGAGGALDEVELEDEAVVMSVQQGLRSRFYQRGRYSPTREQGVHHFHRLIGRAMAGAAPR